MVRNNNQFHFRWLKIPSLRYGRVIQFVIFNHLDGKDDFSEDDESSIS